MRFYLRFLIALSGSLLTGNSDVLPSEKLLPSDTLGVLTVPDFTKARSHWAESPTSLLWHDPELRAFREKFLNKVKTDLLTPLERELGIKFEDFANLAQGHLTLALTPSGREGKTNQSPGWLLLVDTRDKSDQLKKILSDLRKNWVASGKSMRKDKIRDVEFTTLILRAEELDKTLKNVFPKWEKDDDVQDHQKSTNTFELSIGQSESLLLAGTVAKDLEKVLIRQSGGLVSSLSELPAFESQRASMFRDALAYGWIHLQPLLEIFSREDRNPESASIPQQLFKLDKALGACGLRDLKTMAFNLIDAPAGTSINVSLAVPESSRKGLFKAFSLDPKEAGPPPFVPADAVKFSRWRLDGQKAWTALETMLVELSPQMGGAIKLVMETAGKDKDPNFDLRKSLVGNLGGDFISYQKIPRGMTPAELDSPPALFMIGSAEPDRLTTAIKMISSLIPSESGAVKECAFLGRRIHSLPLAATPGPDGGRPVDRGLHFSASGGYVAFSSDVSMLEEYLRSGEAKGKTLAEMIGLKEAAQKVGGTGKGFFSFANSSETMRIWLESVKQNPENAGKALVPLAGLAGAANNEKNFREWFDFSLLPPFEKISRFFYFTVYAGGASSEGFNLKFFAPTPPRLRK